MLGNNAANAHFPCNYPLNFHTNKESLFLCYPRIRSLQKVMFSVMSVCLSTREGGPHVTTFHDPLPDLYIGKRAVGLPMKGISYVEFGFKNGILAPSGSKLQSGNKLF